MYRLFWLHGGLRLLGGLSDRFLFFRNFLRDVGIIRQQENHAFSCLVISFLFLRSFLQGEDAEASFSWMRPSSTHKIYSLVSCSSLAWVNLVTGSGSGSGKGAREVSVGGGGAVEVTHMEGMGRD